MTLWRLEWLRLARTGRLWILLGVYALFGVIGPISARYLPDIIERFGGGIKVVVPDPTPLDGMGHFYSNAGQVGLLAVVAVAAAALTLDAHPTWSAFLRTRVASVRQLLLPRVVLTTLGAVLGLVLGTTLAAGLTGVLISAPDVGDVVLGTVFGAVYLAVVTAVVAVAASMTRQVITAVLLAVGILVVLPILQVVSVIEPWLPSKLLGATTSLMAGAPVTELLKATAVAFVTVPALFALAVRRMASREPAAAG